jgi:hypothetical protein
MYKRLKLLLTSETHQGEEERYSGYFSCFVIREIIICLPTPLPYGERHKGTHQRTPSIALEPKTWEVARFLQECGIF